MSTSNRGRALRAVAAGIAAIAATALAVSGAAAAPGDPGVPGDPAVIFSEDFENGQTAAVVDRLTDYTGATGMTYTADPAWLTDCNGWLSSQEKPINGATQVADCVNQLSWNQTQRLAYALGVYAGDPTPSDNHAVSAYTSGNPGANAIEFRTVADIPLSGSGRYLVFSVDVASLNCNASPAIMQFQVLDDNDVPQPVGPPADVCAVPGGQLIPLPAVGVAENGAAIANTIYSAGSIFSTGSSIGIRMINGNGSGVGNDHAFDNIRLLDATPQLDKEFPAVTPVVGQTVELTFTVTNTSDLAAKLGWSFADTLPGAMTVAAPALTTCPNGIVNAPIGSGSVTVAGDLTAGMASCTVTVPVTTLVPGTYTNGPDDVQTSGLDAPAATSIEFEAVRPELTLTKTADALADEFVAGQEITYTFEIENTGNVPVTDVEVEEVEFSGTGTPPVIVCGPGVADMGPGDIETCTGTYIATEEDVAAGSITNAATATGTSEAGEVVSAISTVGVAAIPLPAIEVVKTADVDTITRAGETVTYTFTVTNTGNVAVTDVEIVEGDFSGTGALSPVECPPEAELLDLGESVDCTATYVVTAADLEADTLENTASATATGPDDEPVEADPSSVEIDVVPALAASGSDGAFAGFVAALLLAFGGLVVGMRRVA